MLVLLFAITDFVWDRVMVGNVVVGVVAFRVARLHEMRRSVRHVIQERTARDIIAVLIPWLSVLSSILSGLLPDLDIYDLL